jgi:hypothetical protein
VSSASSGAVRGAGCLCVLEEGVSEIERGWGREIERGCACVCEFLHARMGVCGGGTSM